MWLIRGSTFSMITFQTLDLQHNRINDVDVVDIMSAMKDLRVLYLQGNPVVKHIRHYRKTLVSKCVNLKYLDDRYEVTANWCAAVSICTIARTRQHSVWSLIKRPSVNATVDQAILCRALSEEFTTQFVEQICTTQCTPGSCDTCIGLCLTRNACDVKHGRKV